METFKLTPESITLERIMRATEELLATKKVSGIRMRDIAQQAGVSMGTLHYHFRTKTSLLLAVLEGIKLFFEKRQVQLSNTEISVFEKIQLFTDQQCQLLREKPEIEEISLDFWGHGMVNEEIREKSVAMYELWQQDINMALEQGVKNGDFDPVQAKVVPYLLVALLEGVALQYLPKREIFPLDYVMDSVHQMICLWLTHMPPKQMRFQSKDGSAAGRKPYPSDVSDRQWELLMPLILPAREGGRPRTTSIREIINAISYMKTTDCSWRMLPHDFPSWQTVYAYYKLWKNDGTLKNIGELLGTNLDLRGTDE